MSEAPSESEQGGGIVEITNDPTTLKMLIDEMVKAIHGEAGRAASRELSLAVTKLQEARMWITEHQAQG